VKSQGSSAGLFAGASVILGGIYPRQRIDLEEKANVSTRTFFEMGITPGWAKRLFPRATKGGKKSPSDGSGSGTAVITRTRTQPQRPSMYRVLLLNDDYTPMEFVISVLRTYFHKDLEDANRIMWQVHNQGVGGC